MLPQLLVIESIKIDRNPSFISKFSVFFKIHPPVNKTKNRSIQIPHLPKVHPPPINKTKNRSVQIPDLLPPEDHIKKLEKFKNSIPSPKFTLQLQFPQLIKNKRSKIDPSKFPIFFYSDRIRRAKNGKSIRPNSSPSIVAKQSIRAHQISQSVKSSAKIGHGTIILH